MDKQELVGILNQAGVMYAFNMESFPINPGKLAEICKLAMETLVRREVIFNSETNELLSHEEIRKLLQIKLDESIELYKMSGSLVHLDEVVTLSSVLSQEYNQTVEFKL